MNIVVCDICGKRITTSEPVVNGLYVRIEEYQTGARIKNFDVCPDCEDRICRIIGDMKFKRDIGIFD